MERSLCVPANDGRDHINVYSKGRTVLGQLLSNFTRCDLQTEDGDFWSIEGLWYWLRVDPSTQGRETLRVLHGFQAKERGRSLLKEQVNQADYDDSAEFMRKIQKALDYKLKNMMHQGQSLKDMLKDSVLPLVHYYSYGSPPRIHIPDRGLWVLEHLELRRRQLKAGTIT